MMTIRRSEERGHFDHGWLDTYHTFSFGDYRDPDHMGFRSLRVINEDRVAPGQGFGMHPHRDMEIVTYVVEGALQHRDSIGNGEVIRPGDVQHMTAGTGVFHSEFNPSATEPVHLLQIWIQPRERGLTPRYGQRHFAVAERTGRLRLVGSSDGQQGSVPIQQDVQVYATMLKAGDTMQVPIRTHRHAWVQVVRGDLAVNGQALRAGDGAAVSGEPSLELRAESEAEALVFDLA